MVPLPSAEALGPRYQSYAISTLESASARVVVAGDSSHRNVFEGGPHRGQWRFMQIEDRRAAHFEPAAPADTALLQFTSGSSGSPRGVRITRANLQSNVEMIRSWLDVQRGDSAASWLPFHHDMGLVGMLVASVCGQTTLWQMTPRDFLLEPLRWLECFGVRGATFAAAPSFAYAYVSRRVKPEQLQGMDFSGWRSAIAGAERLDAGALANFAELLAPHGFEPVALRPAYGLAEATLAVTGHPVELVPRIVRVRPGSLREREPVEIEHCGLLTEADDADLHRHLVSSGVPLPGVDVEVVTDEGFALPDGHLGQISVRGPGVADGYTVEPSASVTGFEPDRLRTGDAGFLLDGELYVLGRIGESIKVRGRMIYAEALEIAIASALDLPLNRCAVISTQHTGENAIVAVVELPAGSWSGEVVRTLRSELGPSLKLFVYSAASGAIPRTTSGKPRRRRLWQQIASKQLESALVFPSDADAPIS